MSSRTEATPSAVLIQMEKRIYMKIKQTFEDTSIFSQMEKEHENKTKI